MTNDGNERGPTPRTTPGASTSGVEAARPRRPLPVKSRSGLAVAGLRLGPSAIGAIGLPFAQYADASANRAAEPGVVEIRFDEATAGRMRVHVRFRDREAQNGPCPAARDDACVMPLTVQAAATGPAFAAAPMRGRL